jgi:hypothetical protein
MSWLKRHADRRPPPGVEPDKRLGRTESYRSPDHRAGREAVRVWDFHTQNPPTIINIIGKRRVYRGQYFGGSRRGSVIL